jgi:hypothetical protein
VDPRTRNIADRTQMGASPAWKPGHQLKPRNLVSTGARSVSARQVSHNRNSHPDTFRGRAETVRPSTAGQWMSRSQTGISPRSFGSSGERTPVSRSNMSRGGDSLGGIRGSSGLGGGNFSGGGGRR